MDQGGILSIRTWEESEYLYLEIQDTGSGMSEEDLSKLGQPFYTTKGEKGTGSGLLLPYSIVHNMKGAIEVISDFLGDYFLTQIFNDN